jgi:F-type H+-transporting ATPase subunit epsilon
MTLLLKIITQENQLLEEEVDSVTLPTVEGQITVLPHHVPLFTKIQTGEITYRFQNQEHSVVVSDGFIDVNPQNMVTVMCDTAIRATDIDLLKAEEAKKAAEEAMAQKTDERDFVLAEASLRKALMEIQAYNKRKKLS